MNLDVKLALPDSHNLRTALAHVIEAEGLVQSLTDDAEPLEIEAWSASIGWRSLIDSAERLDLDPESKLLINAIACKIRANERLQIANALSPVGGDPAQFGKLPPNIRRFFVEAISNCQSGLESIDRLESLDVDLVDNATRGLLHWHAARASVPLLDIAGTCTHYAGVVTYLPGSKQAAYAMEFFGNLEEFWETDAGLVSELVPAEKHPKGQKLCVNRKQMNLLAAKLVSAQQQSDAAVLKVILKQMSELYERAQQAPPPAPPKVAQSAVQPPPVQKRKAPPTAAPTVPGGEAELKIAWICTILGLCFVPALFVGLYYAHTAVGKGKLEARLPRTIGLGYLGLLALMFVFSSIGPNSNFLMSVVGLLAVVLVVGGGLYVWSLMTSGLSSAINNETRRLEEQTRRNQEAMRKDQENRRR